MRKIMIMSALLVLMTGAVLADTLYLRDGSVIQGSFVGFENGQFTFQAGDGTQTKYLTRLVLRVVIARAAATDDFRSRRIGRRDTSANWESIAPFDVRLEDRWIPSQIQVTSGQRVRVEATGTVTLEGRTAANPEGLSNQRYTDAPLPNEPDGALIAVIGKDTNAPPILIGRQKEFVADRDGMLYFTVNHWETRNAGGAFRVNVSLNRGATGWAGSSTGTTQKREKVVTVPGNQAWIDTGIDLDSSGTIEIVAEGQVQIGVNRTPTGPDGDRTANSSTATYPIQSSGVGALIARIRYRNGNDSSAIFIGSSNQVRIGPSQYGRLFIGINDNYLRDNTGSYSVTIRW